MLNVLNKTQFNNYSILIIKFIPFFFVEFTDKNAQKLYKLRNPLAKQLVRNLLRYKSPVFTSEWKPIWTD